jgi:hypothetical protein
MATRTVQALLSLVREQKQSALQIFELSDSHRTKKSRSIVQIN